MIRHRLIPILLIAGLTACAARSTRPNFDFGNRLAMRGIWKEAAFRWQISLETEGESSAIHNNLAIAYERMGKLDLAEKEYQKALALDRDNPQIKYNFDLFSRKKKGE